MAAVKRVRENRPAGMLQTVPMSPAAARRPSDVAYGAATDQGRVRRSNEDSYLVDSPLFAVADGMGGAAAGETASRAAVDVLEAGYRGQGIEVPTDLSRFLQEANAEVLGRARSDVSLTGMGTTSTVLWLSGGQAHVAHVGDSRAYRLRAGELRQLTTDHTLVAHLVQEGRLTEEEAERDPNRHILSRALGVGPQLEVDLLTEELRPGDRFLLCSDGLTNMLTTDQIATILGGEPDPTRAANRLVAAANEAGGTDNITVLVVDPAGGGASPGVGAGAGRRGGGPPRRLFAAALILGAAALAVAAVVAAPLLPGLGPAATPGNPSPRPTVPLATGRPTPGSTTRSTPTLKPTPIPTRAPPSLTGSPNPSARSPRTVPPRSSPDPTLPAGSDH